MIIVMLLAGLAAGILSSMGFGGGTVLLLYLRLFTETEPLRAQHMNLIFFVPSAILALIIYSKRRMIRWRLVLPVCAIAAMGAMIGVFLSGLLDSEIINKLFAGLLIVIGLTGLFSRKNRTNA